MEDDKSIGEHIHVFRTILDELIARGGTIDVDEQIEFFLGNIFYSYCIVIAFLSMTAIAFQNAMSRLLYMELQMERSSNVFWTKESPISKIRKEILLIKGLDHRPISPIIVMEKT